MENALISRLQSLIAAFKQMHAQELKRIGSIVVEEAVVKNDKNFALLGTISYSLYKILTKDHFIKNSAWGKVSNSIINSLQKALMAAQKNDEKKFEISLEEVIAKIEIIDNDLSNFARNIFEKAKVKQASTAYAMGMSLNQAAELTGANKADLQKYIGGTRIHDEQPSRRGIDERMKSLREVVEK